MILDGTIIASDRCKEPAVSVKPDLAHLVRMALARRMALDAVLRSSGMGSAPVRVWSPAWISMVRQRWAVLTNLRIDQPVCCSIHRLTASAANTMVKCASMESRRWW